MAFTIELKCVEWGSGGPIAQQVARHGQAVIAKLDGEPDSLYLVRVERIARRFGGVPLYPLRL